MQENIIESKTFKGKTTRRNKTGFKGVTHIKYNHRWAAWVLIDSQKFYLGSFSEAEEAARAYDNAVRKHYGERGKYNFPREGENSAIILKDSNNFFMKNFSE